ncbi:MAG: hypothetical protein H8D26_03925 [Methanomicrobia archaeon]|nr:hypothetical protein [Methanomicrobia archaeon]
MRDIGDLGRIVEETSDIDGIEGYKVGAILALKYGLSQICEKISSYTDLPIVYDHQKLGTDIPEISGGDILEVCKEAGVKGVIIFPQSGPETLKATVIGSENEKLKDTVRGCFKLGLTPIVGGEMTHNKYLRSEGGYIADDAPKRMYMDAAKLGVEHFVIPGTKIEKMRGYCLLLEKELKEPKFLFPGIGKEYQGGDIVAAFETVKPFSSYAIIGRAIYAAEDIKSATRRLCEVAKSFL